MATSKTTSGTTTTPGILKDVSVQSAYAGMPSVQALPTNIVRPGVMSNTSVAGDCFVYQRFSLKLQAYMVSYVNNLAGSYPIPYA